MKLHLLLIVLFSFPELALSQVRNRRKSPPTVKSVANPELKVAPKTKFPLGNGVDKWGVELKIPDNEMSLRLGARYQSLATIDRDGQDFQSRRVRFQFEAKLPHDITYYMDIRNDGANEDDKGERSFQIGDAYVQVPFDTDGSFVSILRLYRAKVDVSRTQTVSSSSLVFVNRPEVADEAAQFVNHARRATNAQLIGDIWKRIYYQVVIGDGVHSDRFFDAKGEPIERIEGQNFMVGGKLRISPFAGWEDMKVSETYFGEGKHFSIGAGFFNTSKIKTVNANDDENTISRNLTNLEASFHYKEWSLFSEYFIFDGVVEDHSAADFNKGKSDGWFIQGEKLFTEFHFLAPFARFETWDRFDSGFYESKSQLYGINWYANGNRFKMSLAYEHATNEEDTGLAKVADSYHLATAWHF